MRALCGAIIAAGSLIGLGLACLGIGNRYSNFHRDLEDTTILFVRFKMLDTPLQFGLVFLSIAAVIGIGLTFVGLGYHHERRLREHQLALQGHATDRAKVIQ
jgi:hypothetical protein